jgi:hypothetical protein
MSAQQLGLRQLQRPGLVVVGWRELVLLLRMELMPWLYSSGKHGRVRCQHAPALLDMVLQLDAVLTIL